MGIANFLKQHAKNGASLAGKQLVDGLNRVDELGGELRDYLLERDDAPRLRALGVRLAKLGGVNLEDVAGPSDYEQEIAAASAAAPPPTAADIATAEKTGPGDADIAAQIYGKQSCPWTGRARTMLNEAKVDFDFIELDDSENTHWEGKLNSQTGQNTVPYVFLRGEFVGGFNELSEVVRLGQLDYRTLTQADRTAADATRPHASVEIASRTETTA